jgi:hypothetical protein
LKDAFKISSFLLADTAKLLETMIRKGAALGAKGFVPHSIKVSGPFVSKENDELWLIECAEVGEPNSKKTKKALEGREGE